MSRYPKGQERFPGDGYLYVGTYARGLVAVGLMNVSMHLLDLQKLLSITCGSQQGVYTTSLVIRRGSEDR